MKKLTFKVSNRNEESIIALIKEVNKIDCRIQIDIENGVVIAEDIDDTMIDTIIELINNYYTLLCVDIDNRVEKEITTPVLEGTIGMSDQNRSVSEAKATVRSFEQQCEDNLIIKKVEFENEYVEQIVNRLLKTAYWAIFKMNVPEKELGDFIWTSINEISMRYSKKNRIPFSIGDVVTCNYGKHLGGEINGSYIPSIVCNISNTDMAYLVPITKNQENIISQSHVTITVPDDIIYYTRNYVDGTVLLDKGKYVHTARFHEVIGKTSPEFLEKILYKLATTFDFTHGVSERFE